MKLHEVGPKVIAWQQFLVDRRLLTGPASGSFDVATHNATIAFQKSQGLGADGIVGPKTLAVAGPLGYVAPVVVASPSTVAEPGWPLKPPDVKPMNAAARQALFGSFQYVPAPTPGNPEAIKILGDWAAKNIVTIAIPQLIGVAGAHPRGLVSCNKAIANQLKALFAAWEKAGLLHLIETFDGSWAPRFIRGSKTSLSNHAVGSAMDLNSRWNPLSSKGALVGSRGSVVALVPLAIEHGFFWGGHFTIRPDPMHFEAFKTL